MFALPEYTETMAALNLDHGPLLLGLRPQGSTAVAETPRLRIGIVVDGPRIQQWIKDLIEWLQGIGCFDVRLFIPEASKAQDIPLPSRVFQSTYAYSCRRYDPFRTVTLVPEPEMSIFRASNNTSPGRRSSEPEVDIFFWLAAEPLRSGPCTKLSRLGI